MANYRLLIAQGKQIVFEDERDFVDVWKSIGDGQSIEFDGEIVDGDDRFMGHVAIRSDQVIGLLLEHSRSLAGR
jgi:hypothetical protein